MPLIENAVIHFGNELRQAPDNVAREHSAAVPKVALVTNIPAPYRVPVYNRLARDGRINFTVIFCAKREPDRHWDLEQFEFKSVVLNQSFITRAGRYIHNNIDVMGQLKAIDPAVVITDGFNPTHLYAFLYAWWHGRKHNMLDGWHICVGAPLLRAA